MRHVATVLASLCLWPAPSPAAAPPGSLAWERRPIRKEPAYVGRPLYCLLVFGPEARTRVWLALDGDMLYVDRDGDGDLTGPGERVKLPPMEPHEGGWGSGMREAKLGDVREGRLTHTGLSLVQLRPRPGFSPRTEDDEDMVRLLGGDFKRDVFGVEVVASRGDGTRLHQSAIEGAHGALRFSPRAADAPVVHFNGPLSMGLRGAPKLLLGARPADLKACVGTPRLGKGTFATAVYEGLVPERAHPAAEVTFPARRGAGPQRVRLSLTRRC